ncbi:nuclear transport factor 2 family protein [Novosphingobium capsulatum]|uniref:nuclear transport factor 2 family protein n=1 Tax=Novosphingobium capsulatum TaxID=13688 RepID=UPI0007873278|nr:nuclear transport factor 2 family protein [Novosphingobium capsulatum]WQD94110.1 nuclear transport factor 2 family protein [Novosphingobium capsulatum]
MLRHALIAAGLFALPLAAVPLASLPTPVHAQEAVVAVPDPESLFTSPDPVLNRNKQAALHIVKDLLECGHWDKADQYLTPAYHQHNPMVPSGRDTVVHFFTQVVKVQPKACPAHMATPVAAVTAEGDRVVVSMVRTLKDPKNPGKTYTTTWFDMWRFVDGKADEHWDGATLADAAP